MSLLINVSDLLKINGSERRVRKKVKLPSLRRGIDKVEFIEPSRLDVILRNVNGKIFVEGNLQAKIWLICSRCLNKFPYILKIKISELFRKLAELRGKELLEIEDEKPFSIVSDEIDLEPLAEQSILLSLPMKPLCKDTCQGLCQICGENLNEKPHTHKGEEIDSRLEALKKFLKNSS